MQDADGYWFLIFGTPAVLIWALGVYFLTKQICESLLPARCTCLCDITFVCGRGQVGRGESIPTGLQVSSGQVYSLGFCVSKCKHSTSLIVKKALSCRLINGFRCWDTRGSMLPRRSKDAFGLKARGIQLQFLISVTYPKWGACPND